jgi:hypothetical protein
MAKTISKTTDPTGPEESGTPAPAEDGDQEQAATAGYDSQVPEQLPPGVYEYVHSAGCVYPHVPLTCHAYQPAVPETQDSPGGPERPATVFEWVDGPPADGRWAKTRKKPNQAADNAGGLLSSKE